MAGLPMPGKLPVARANGVRLHAPATTSQVLRVTSAARLLPAALASLIALGGTKPGHAAAPGWEEQGQASWYGGRHHGRRTSTGEVFNQDAMTAAHTTLPLGSRVRVTHERTGESVVVTINDRMPPKGLRVIDLSRGAAARLDMVRSGTAMVQLTALPGGVEEASPAPRDRPQTRRARPTASADRPCCRAPSATPVRHSARRPAAPHRL